MKTIISKLPMLILAASALFTSLSATAKADSYSSQGDRGYYCSDRGEHICYREPVCRTESYVYREPCYQQTWQGDRSYQCSDRGTHIYYREPSCHTEASVYREHCYQQSSESSCRYQGGSQCHYTR